MRLGRHFNRKVTPSLSAVVPFGGPISRHRKAVRLPSSRVARFAAEGAAVGREGEETLDEATRAVPAKP